LLKQIRDVAHAGADSCGASLARVRVLPHNRRFAVTPVTSTAKLVRYEETINGRPYVIEVSAVSQNRWRAQIARLPGGRAALMPFYGTTAQEAAVQLRGWLTRASRAQ
jgi:hypothetical protein